MTHYQPTFFQQKKSTKSIQKRLLVSLLIGLPTLWLTVILSIAWQLWHEINDINDAQLVQIARYLLITEPNSTIKNAKKAVSLTDIDLNDNLDKEDDQPLNQDIDEINEDDEDTGFAIWDRQGRLLLSDGDGDEFVFLAKHQGFLEKNHSEYQQVNDFSHRWRLFYVQDRQRQRVIAVGQNLQNREEMIIESLSTQIMPALIGLIIFVALVIWLVRRGFAPLTQVSQQLSRRNPHDDRPIDIAVPSEIQPLVTSLNQLFVKVADTLAREQRFTADASHELRSPLTALKLQADVLQHQILQADLSEKDQDQLFHHIQQMELGIDRANHLVEQLLILAKLEPQQGLTKEQLQPINWLDLTDTVLSDVNRNAREKHSQLKREILCKNPIEILPLQGNVTLLSLLLRNLLDNAIRYCPENSIIKVQLNKNNICVIDNGLGVSQADLNRLSERFFRPAGQTERGSGLGLSIVKRIADLHGLTLTIANRIENGKIIGFMVKISQS